MKAVWLIPIAILAAGCSQADTDHLQKDAQSIAKDAGEAATSLTLAGKVNGVLRVMKKIDGSDIKVSAKDGVVTLEGKAKDDTQRDFILDTTMGVKGVDKVINKLVIDK